MRKAIGIVVLLAAVASGCPDKAANDGAEADAAKTIAEAEKAIAGAAREIEKAAARMPDRAPEGVPPDLARFFTEFVRVRVEKDLDGLWMMMAPDAQQAFADSIEAMKEKTEAAIEKDPANAKKRVPKVLVPGEAFLEMEVKDAYAAVTGQQLTGPVVAAYQGAKLVSASKAADGKSATLRFSQPGDKLFDLELAAGEGGRWLVVSKAPAADDAEPAEPAGEAEAPKGEGSEPKK